MFSILFFKTLLKVSGAIFFCELYMNFLVSYYFRELKKELCDLFRNGLCILDYVTGNKFVFISKTGQVK